MEPDITQLLLDAQGGKTGAVSALYDRVYARLRRIAHRQLAGRNATLQTTDLVHEAYVKMCDPARLGVRDRGHFFALSARAMRQILVDHFRSASAGKRGDGRRPVTLQEGIVPVSQRGEVLLALDEALTRLASLSPRLGQVVECRFFGGMTQDEIAAHLGVSERTVRGDWLKAKAWLARELGAT